MNDAVEAVEIVADLDLRGLQVEIEPEDGDLTLVLNDGDVGIRLTTGLGGTYEDAITGAERLAGLADQFVALLKVRAGGTDPFARAAPGRDQMAGGPPESP